MKQLSREWPSSSSNQPRFVPDYTSCLIEIGENDVAARLDELRAFLGEPVGTAISAV